MGMREDECIVTEDAADAVVEIYRNTPGVRDMEQAAEHIAANALYRIESGNETGVTYDAAAVHALEM